MIRSVGIVGYGHFGAFVHEMLKRFTPDVVVRVYSRTRQPDGTLFFPIEDVATSDVIVFAVPIHAFEENLARFLPHIPERSVIVDATTVKVYTTEILKRLAGGRRYIATHPMFGPESYAKSGNDVTGFRIVIAEHTLGAQEYASLVAFLRGLTFDVVEMPATKHDKHLAETLFLTHFIGQVITRAGFTRTEIDTVSFGFLMNAVESVKHDRALFLDVFRFNPYCREILDRFEVSEHDVRSVLDRSVE